MKTEHLVLIALGLVLVALEVVSRKVEPLLSADVRQMLAQNEIPDRVRQARSEGRPSILVIGNSLARASILPDEIAGALETADGKPAEVFYITPDASGINEWAAAYRKAFPLGSEVVRPDQIILVTGPGHLVDHAVTSPEKLSAYHVSPADRWMVAREWLPNLGTRCRYALAGVSRLFANRERVQPLVFYGLVPGYEATAQRLNQARNQQDARSSGHNVKTVERLELLLDALGVDPARVLIVAVPLPNHYELTPTVLAAAAERRITVYAEAAASDWPASAFPDGYHIGPEEGRKFSIRVRDQVRVLRSSLPVPP